MSNLKKHALSLFAFGTLGLVFVTIIVIGFWVFVPYQTITFNNDPVYELNKLEIRQGETVSYSIDYCKYTDAIPTVKKIFEDGIVFVSEDTRAILGIGCHKQSIPLYIPMTLPPGRYRLGIELTYKVNPIINDRQKHYSNWFTVLRSDTGAYGDSTNDGVTPQTKLDN